MFWNTDFIDNVSTAAADMIRSFEYEIGGVWKTADLIAVGRETAGNVCNYFTLKIPANAEGTITGFRVIGTNDKIIGSKAENIVKSSGAAMIYKFKIRVYEEEK